jgi:hypothetical protein
MQGDQPKWNKHKDKQQEQVTESSKVNEWVNRWGDTRCEICFPYFIPFYQNHFNWRGVVPQSLHLLLHWTHHKGESTPPLNGASRGGN